MWPPNVTLFASRLEDHVSSGKRGPLLGLFMWKHGYQFDFSNSDGYIEKKLTRHTLSLDWSHCMEFENEQCEGERVISLEKQICLGVVGSEGSEPSERWGWKYPHYFTFSSSSCSQTSRIRKGERTVHFHLLTSIFPPFRLLVWTFSFRRFEISFSSSDSCRVRYVSSIEESSSSMLSISRVLGWFEHSNVRNPSYT